MCFLFPSLQCLCLCCFISFPQCLGFGSLDARRRDEFTLDIRAQQYKELLKSEHYFNQKYVDEMSQRTTYALTSRSSGEEEKDEERQRARSADAHLFQNQVSTKGI